MITETSTTIVVDDEPANRDFIVRLLQTAKLEVYGSGTGAEALEMAHKLPELKLALIDHELPDVHGIDLVRQVRALHPDAVLVMATMHDVRDIIDQAFEAGVDVFLVKPHGFMELYRRVLERQPEAANLRRLIIDQYGPRPYKGPKRNTQTLVAVGL
jgi:two-component system cell cycle response regulator CtrA